jgi:hypothetical protein
VKRNEIVAAVAALAVTATMLACGAPRGGDDCDDDDSMGRMVQMLDDCDND